MADDQELVRATSFELETYLGKEEADRLQDPEEISLRIVQGILAAQTPEELLRQQDVIGARDVLRIPLHVVDVAYNVSALEEGVGVYALVTADRLDKEGERLMISCGARNVMAQLFKAKEMGWLPLDVRFVETDKATARGFRPMSLRPLVADDDF